MEWRKINELPDEVERFLAWDPIKGEAFIGLHPSCGQVYEQSRHDVWGGRWIDGVTHWMPLPPPPEATP